MSGSLTRGGGENVPGIPGACATRNFTYLVRGPWRKELIHLLLLQWNRNQNSKFFYQEFENIAKQNTYHFCSDLNVSALRQFLHSTSTTNNSWRRWATMAYLFLPIGNNDVLFLLHVQLWFLNFSRYAMHQYHVNKQHIPSFTPNCSTYNPGVVVLGRYSRPLTYNLARLSPSLAPYAISSTAHPGHNSSYWNTSSKGKLTFKKFLGSISILLPSVNQWENMLM